MKERKNKKKSYLILNWAKACSFRPAPSQKEERRSPQKVPDLTQQKKRENKRIRMIRPSFFFRLDQT